MPYFEVYQTAAPNWAWSFKDDGGDELATSRDFTSSQSCSRSIDNIRTLDTYFDIHRTPANSWEWWFRDAGGEVIAGSKYYSSKDACQRALDQIRASDASPIYTASAWPTLVDSATGLRINHRPSWFAQSGAGPRTVNISNVPELSPIDEATLVTESIFQVRRLVNANPAQLSIGSWFDTFFSVGFSSPILSRTTVLIDNRSSIQIELSGIGRSIHTYVPDLSDVLELAFGLQNRMFEIDYRRISMYLRFPSAIQEAIGGMNSRTNPSPSSNDAVDFALQELGKPYRSGGNGPDYWDCSGLTKYAYSRVNIVIPRKSSEQATAGIAASPPNQRGDLLFYATDDTTPGVVSHCGIYWENNKMIHAPRTGSFVRAEDIMGRYWPARFVCARRFPSSASGFTGQYTSTEIIGEYTHTESNKVQGNSVAGDHQFRGPTSGSFTWTGTITPVTATTGTISGSGTIDNDGIRPFTASGNIVINPDGTADMYWSGTDPKFGAIGGSSHRTSAANHLE